MFVPRCWSDARLDGAQSPIARGCKRSPASSSSLMPWSTPRRVPFEMESRSATPTCEFDFLGPTVSRAYASTSPSGQAERAPIKVTSLLSLPCQAWAFVSLLLMRGRPADCLSAGSGGEPSVLDSARHAEDRPHGDPTWTTDTWAEAH